MMQFFAVAALSVSVGRSPAVRPRHAPVHAKITGAALAAAFAAKDDAEPAEPLSIEEREERVVAAVRAGLDAGIQKPRALWSALGDFGRESGGLAQTWLTPQQAEKCFAFWGGGTTILARDIKRFKLSGRDLAAFPPFALLLVNTFPWTPLLVPLVGRAVNSTDGASFVPRSFRSDRLAALERLRGDGGLCDPDGCDIDERTPQGIDEGVRFFRDGSRMLARDFLRGRPLAYGDTAKAYALFFALVFSTFPLTPLLIPLIDKRRDGPQSDFVPSAYRGRRLAAFARYRAARDAETATPEATIRRAAGTEDRPSTAELLAAIVALPGAPADRAHFFDRLAGGGSPGRRWKLVYTATADAVKAARKGGGAPSLGFVDRFTLKSGVYCDEFATAIQRFDAETCENENGIFELFGSDAVKFTVKGPFKWPDAERRAICAFRPTSAFLKLGPLEREWPLEAEEPPFDDARPTQLPFFKFLLVDDEVAVAQGRTGGVAVWARE